MTRFDELVALSMKQSAMQQEQEVRLVQFALKIKEFLVSSLETTKERICFRILGEDLRQIVAAQDTEIPRLAIGKDGFYYFGLRVYFTVPVTPNDTGREGVGIVTTFYLGIRTFNGDFIIRGDKDRPIKGDDDLKQFTESLYTQLKEMFSSSVGGGASDNRFCATE